MKKTFLLLLLTLTLYGQKLPRSTPEAQGVSSHQISDFIHAWEKSPQHEPHSFMILRHGKVIAEGWWKPYNPSLLHTMYSVSKSFTATAVGFAVAEGKLKLDDRVYSFFPEKNPVNVSDLQNKLTVKDLLTMSTGQQQEPIYMMAEDDWVNAFLRANITYEPGTHFMYNSPATYMLSAIVQKVTGERLFDYLQPRLFLPLEITNIDWEVDPSDINTGGWGLRLKTEDMAKFGQLFLQKGVWKGKQLLPKGWVEEASKAQIFQPEPVDENLRKNSDWYQGYGYQMWRGKNNTYRADGAYGQNIIVVPEKDAVIITTGESSDLQDLLNLIWTELLPAFDNRKTPKVKLKPLALPALASINNTQEESAKYVLLKPHGTLKALNLNFSSEQLLVTFETDSVHHTIPFGKGKWIESVTSMKGPYIFPKIKANRSKIPTQKIAASYGWKDAQTLILAIKYIESLHTETYTLKLDGENATIDFSNIIKSSKGNQAIRDFGKPSAPKLIIRGDDMGYSHSGNLAIMKSALEGVQTSIEVLAAAPWFPEAVKMLKNHPKLDVGLHFTLTSEWDNIKWRPLTAAKSLRDEDGFFYPMIGKNSYYPNQALMDHKYDLKDIELELRAQIELLKKHIPHVSHITGHMGCTMFTPEVKEMVRKVAKEYNLPVMDSDAFYDYGIQYVWIDSRNKNTEERIEAFIKLLDKLEENKSYVFLEHPGLDNEELRAIHHIGYENVAEDRQAVTDLFTSEKVKKAIYLKGIKLLSYKEFLNK